MRTCLYTLTVLCLTVLTSTIHATIIRVPADQPTIQAGIDAAVDGDTVLVADGVYTGVGNRDLDFDGKNISCMSENGPALTIIDCQGAGRGFNFHSQELYGSLVKGFTIANGTSTWPEGGGIFATVSSNPIISNCKFYGNSPVGMSNIESSPRIVDCEFNGNSAYGMYNYGGTPTIENSTFSGHTVYGMFNNESSPTVTNCTFSGNLSYGMSNTLGTPEVDDCTFSENTYGGMNNYQSNPQVYNSTFSGNGSYGMNNYQSSPHVENSTFSEHTLSGMYNNESSPMVTGCDFSDNLSSGMDNYLGSPVVLNCFFNANGGGGMYNYLCTPTVNNCTFNGNTAVNGGGMNNVESNTTVANCLFIGNSADYGGGIHNDYCSPMITNCTFNKNEANMNGSGVASGNGGSPTVTNCILWGGIGLEPVYSNYSNPVVTYCNVEGGYPGEGNINLEPLFADPECYLQSNSPCIDTGDIFWIDACRPPGLGEARSDMGAYGGEENCGWPLALIELFLEPTGSVQIPKGDTFYFDVIINNNSPNTISGDFWLNVAFPNNNELLVPPLYLNYANPRSGQVSPNNSLTLHYAFDIPVNAPTGPYQLRGYGGRFDNVILKRRWLDFQIINN